jgi:hypothetical protein
MKKYSRVLAGILAVLLSAGCTGLYAAAQSDSSSAADSTASTTKNESDKKDTKDTKKADKSDSDTEKQAKEETVYVITDASGNKTKTVVSNWLKNPQGVKKLEDVSDLTDIENVKTDEGFTANGDKLTWDTEGGDIYYKGYTDKALPVDVKVTYTLDGKEIKPEDLAGKSGKLTVRYDYTNNDKKTVKINGKKTDIYVPYLMATTAILDTNVYSNVEVTNGKLISDGSRQILIGVAMPGLTKSLDLQDNEDIEIPEYVEFTADVKDFESTTSLTVATSDIYNAIRRDALLENVTLDENGKIDFADKSVTENTRVSYPIDHIQNIVRPISSAPAAKNVIFLSADAFGVLPPVSILTPEQTQYYFLSGFTAKLAGTERGITEPTPTFSACFGQAFLELHPTKYAEELVKKMEKSGAKAYLVNTGWNGTGKRISIKDTRGIIDAILNGDILNAPTKKIPHFDFEVPTELPGVDPAILDPRDTYADASEWETKAKDLASRFVKNFAKYEGNPAGKALVSAGPKE